MDIWDLVNQVRIELPVEFGFIHPQLCNDDGDRFFADFLKAHRKVIVAACAPNMQRKLFKDAFSAASMSVEEDLVPIDIRKMTTDNAFELVKYALVKLGFEEEII
ncbi:MAG: hypothetical protein FWF06_00780 [Symbiobacteriaceae bacterium]|nr:hypothetical protein [Symbiobacteriaceae bacterium]